MGRNESIRRVALAAAAAASLLGAPAVFAKSPGGPAGGYLTSNVVAVRDASDRPIFDFVVTGASIVDGKLQLRGTVRKPGATGAGTPATASLAGTLAKEPSPAYAEGRRRRAEAQRRMTPVPAAGATTDQKPGGPATTGEAAGQMGQLAQSTQSTSRDTPEAAPEGGEKPKDAKPAMKVEPTDTTGCDMLFFQLAVPGQFASAAGGQRLQVNVALARRDNATGIGISRMICGVVTAMAANDNAGATRAAQDLDRALGAAK